MGGLRDRRRRRDRLLAYFYEPQWTHAKVPLVRVALPPFTPGCDADPETVACDYPPYVLDKIVSTRFADTGGAAFDLVRRFTWTNADQNRVADDIASRRLTPEAAAARWLDEHEVWRRWMPRSSGAGARLTGTRPAP